MIWKPKATKHYDFTRMTDRQIAIELGRVRRDVDHLLTRMDQVEEQVTISEYRRKV
jgi:hypothetical protein